MASSFVLVTIGWPLTLGARGFIGCAVFGLIASGIPCCFAFSSEKRANIVVVRAPFMQLTVVVSRDALQTVWS